MPLTSRREVVVTGLGCVSPLGATAAETWEGAIAGRSGVGKIQRFDCSNFSVQIAAEAPAKFEIGELSAQGGPAARPLRAVRFGGRPRGVRRGPADS